MTVAAMRAASLEKAGTWAEYRGNAGSEAAGTAAAAAAAEKAAAALAVLQACSGEEAREKAVAVTGWVVVGTPILWNPVGSAD